MNDGALSFILYIIFIFIFIGDWIKDEIREAKWKTYRILMILTIMLLSPLVTISISQLTFSSFVYIVPIVGFSLMLKLLPTQRIQVVLGALLFAGVYNLMMETFATDPFLLIIDERLMAGFLLGALVGIFRIPLHIKWVLSTLGTWLGVLYFIFMHQDQLRYILLFSYYELDMLFTLYLSISIVHLLYAFISKWIVRIERHRTKV